MKKRNEINMHVRNSFLWRNAFSSINTVIPVEAGAPVHLQGRDFFVHPSYFKDENIRHDALYYGCRVLESNVVSDEENEFNHQAALSDIEP
jgi:hypothetical protein